MISLAVFEEIIGASGAVARIEAMLPTGVRPRQLTVRALLAGMCLALADGRPAHLTRVHQALTALPEGEQRRLGVLADWDHGPASAHLPADRVHLRPGRRGSRQAGTRRTAVPGAASGLR